VRIIGGALRGRTLFSPKGLAIRPTADRLRESIFNIIGASVSGTSVLDLFAGTGALGLEALSRGANSAVFIDISGKALALIGKNITALGLYEKAQVLRWDVRRNLDCLAQWPCRFSLVFMDPPYARNLVVPTLGHLRACGALAQEALLVVEHASGEPIDPISAGFSLDDNRQYAKTVVSFLRLAM